MLSSTTSTPSGWGSDDDDCRADGAASAGSSARRRGASSASSRGNTTRNVVPTPSVLWTPTVPPSSATMRCTIDRPRPAPADVPAVVADRNGSNTASSSSAGIPAPVSTTSIASRSPPSTIANTRTRPAEVNFIALPTRFDITCRKRTGSVRTRAGIAVSTNAASSTEARESTDAIDTTSFNSERRSTGAISNVTDPFSSLLVVSRSSTTRVRSWS